MNGGMLTRFAVASTGKAKDLQSMYLSYIT